METKFETVEDMVNFITTATHKADSKYMLNCRTSREYINEEEGKKWEEEDNKINVFFSCQDQGNEPAESYYAEKRNEHRKLRPQDKEVKYWSLDEILSGGYWRSRNSIALSNELGELLDGIWKTKKRYDWSSPERTGYVTIPGMLKRLGNTSISKQIKDAQTAAKLLAEKNRRNYERREVNKLAKQIHKIMQDNPKITFPASIAEMAREDFMQVYGEE